MTKGWPCAEQMEERDYTGWLVCEALMMPGTEAWVLQMGEAGWAWPLGAPSHSHPVWLPQSTSQTAQPLMPAGGAISTLQPTTHAMGQGRSGFLLDLPLLWRNKLE